MVSSQMELVVKNLPDNAGDVRYRGSIPGLGSSPGEGNGNPLQCACLENSMDRVTWQALVHGVAKTRTWLSDLAQHIDHIIEYDMIFLFLCLTSLSMKISTSIHAAANDIISFFYGWATFRQYSLYVYTMSSLSILLSMDIWAY